jgi:hypothetical protein
MFRKLRLEQLEERAMFSIAFPEYASECAAGFALRHM